jgi:hypothetical protein
LLDLIDFKTAQWINCWILKNRNCFPWQKEEKEQSKSSEKKKRERRENASTKRAGSSPHLQAPLPPHLVSPPRLPLLLAPAASSRPPRLATPRPFESRRLQPANACEAVSYAAAWGKEAMRGPRRRSGRRRSAWGGSAAGLAWGRGAPSPALPCRHPP